MVKSSIQTFWSEKIISWSLFFQPAPFCQCNHIFLSRAQKQLYIYPSDWLNDILIKLKFKRGRVKTHQGSVRKVATSNIGGRLEDRCSMFTSAWDRKSQLYCIFAALPVTNSQTIQPQIWNCHFHTLLMPSIALLFLFSCIISTYYCYSCNNIINMTLFYSFVPFLAMAWSLLNKFLLFWGFCSSLHSVCLWANCFSAVFFLMLWFLLLC